MRTLADSRALRLTTLTALYITQGLPWGFVTVGYIVLLSDLGLDNAAVGAAMALAYLPWGFKVAWGPLLDAVPPLRIGRRRPFIVASQLLMGGTLLSLMFVDARASLGTVAILLFLNNTFASLQDVAVDALAVDILEEEERGRANSLMWAGKSLGVVAGGGGGTVVASYLGWDALFVLLACVVWAVMLLPLVLRERPPRADDVRVGPGLLRLAWFLLPLAFVGVIMWALSEVESRYAKEAWVVAIPIVQPIAAVLGAIAAWPLIDRAGFRALRRSFSFSTPWWGIAAGVLTPAGYALVGAVLVRLQRVDLGLSAGEIATLSGVVDPASGIGGALVGGLVADKLGPRQAMGGFMLGVAACLAVWAAAPGWWPSWPFLIGWTIAFTAMINAYNAATFGLYMGLSNPRISATHFAVYMASTNLTYAWASPLGGTLADAWGYSALFAAAAGLQVVTVLLVLPLDPRRTAAIYGRGP